jgi:hypothetical protein
MDIIRSIPQFEKLRGPWNALAGKLLNPLLRHEWFLCCANAFHADATLRICIIQKKGNLVAAAPLVAVKTGLKERWELLGVSQLYEPCGFLYDSLQSLSVLTHGLQAQGFPLILQRIGADSVDVSSFKNIPFNRGFTFTRATSPILSLRLPNSYSQLLAKRSANFRYDLKRKQARAKAMGLYGIEFIDPSPTELPNLMQIVLEVEGSGWKGGKGSSLKQKAYLGQFFKEYSRLVAEEGMLRIALLRIDDKIVAVQLSIEASKKLWVLKMGYDEAYSHISPGYLLTAETIRNAIDRKLAGYEFLGVAEPWQERWGAESRAHQLSLFYPASVRGAMSFLLDGVEVTRKHIFARIRNFNNKSPQS